MKKLILVLTLAVTAFCLSSADLRAADEIKIGAILRLSQGASDGLPARRGIEIAEKEINAKGGIGGKKIKVIY